MLQLIKYEWKKLLTIPKLCIISIIIFVLSFSEFIFLNSLANYPSLQAKTQKYTGYITEPHFQEAEDTYLALSEIRENRAFTSEEEIVFNEIETALFDIKLNKLRRDILDEYQIENTDIKFGDGVSYEFLDNYLNFFFPLTITFLISFLIGGLFSNEYEDGMSGLLRTTKHGNKNVITAKVIVAIMITLLMYVLTIGSFSVITLFHYGLSDITIDFINTGKDSFIYIESPFTFTLGQYSTVLLLTSLLGCLAFCIYVMFISSLTKKSIHTSMICLATGVIPWYYHYLAGSGHSILSYFLKFTYGPFMGVRTLFNDAYPITLFGIQIQIVYIVYIFVLLLSVCLFLFTYRNFRTHQDSN